MESLNPGMKPREFLLVARYISNRTWLSVLLITYAFLPPRATIGFRFVLGRKRTLLIAAMVPKWGCNICLEEARDPVCTSCGHLLCWPCLYPWVHELGKPCPVCRAPLIVDADIVPIWDSSAAETSSDIPPRPNPKAAKCRARWHAGGSDPCTTERSCSKAIWETRMDCDRGGTNYSWPRLRPRKWSQPFPHDRKIEWAASHGLQGNSDISYSPASNSLSFKSKFNLSTIVGLWVTSILIAICLFKTLYQKYFRYI